MTYREKTRDGVTRLTGGGNTGAQGVPGAPGAPGTQGPQGTRWGTTPYWSFGDNTDIGCSFPDGGPPRIGDLLICTNGLGVGEVYVITKTYPSGNVDVDTVTNLRGPKGQDLDPPKEFQFATPATSWPFQHDYNTLHPDVTIYDQNNNQIGGDFHAVDANNGLVTFYYPVAGYVRVEK